MLSQFRPVVPKMASMDTMMAIKSFLGICQGGEDRWRKVSTDSFLENAACFLYCPHGNLSTWPSKYPEFPPPVHHGKRLGMRNKLSFMETCPPILSSSVKASFCWFSKKPHDSLRIQFVEESPIFSSSICYFWEYCSIIIHPDIVTQSRFFFLLLSSLLFLRVLFIQGGGKKRNRIIQSWYHLKCPQVTKHQQFSKQTHRWNLIFISTNQRRRYTRRFETNSWAIHKQNGKGLNLPNNLLEMNNSASSIKHLF